MFYNTKKISAPHHHDGERSTNRKTYATILSSEYLTGNPQQSDKHHGDDEERSERGRFRTEALNPRQLLLYLHGVWLAHGHGIAHRLVDSIGGFRLPDPPLGDITVDSIATGVDVDRITLDNQSLDKGRMVQRVGGVACLGLGQIDSARAGRQHTHKQDCYQMFHNNCV